MNPETDVSFERPPDDRRARREPRRGVLRRSAAALAIIAAALAGITAGPSAVSADARPVTASDTACPHMTDSIIRLYSAYFLRAPDQGGFDFWVGEYSAGNRGLQGMSDFFSSSDEFRSLYDNLSNAEFVDLVYRNVLGRPSEPEGRQFWISQLDSGAMSRGTVMISFSESEEYVARTGTAVPLAGYFSWYPEGTGFTCGPEAVALELLPTDDAVDVLAIHDPAVSSQGGFVDVYDVVGNEIFYAESTFVPFDHISVAQYDASFFSAQGVEVIADPQVSIYVVAYPSTMATWDVRNGWRTEDRRQPTMGELVDEMLSAEFASDVFWAREWPKISDQPYDAPFSYGMYDGTRAGNGPRCFGQTLPAFNAVYCPDGHFVAYDVNLFSEALRVNGDAFVYFVVAHEWAHAIQARLPANQVSAATELQADCLAGATLLGVGANALQVDVNGTIFFEEGDVDELLTTFESLDGVPFVDGGSHGSAQERLDSFLFGAEFGISGCLVG